MNKKILKCIYFLSIILILILVIFIGNKLIIKNRNQKILFNIEKSLTNLGEADNYSIEVFNIDKNTIEKVFYKNGIYYVLDSTNTILYIDKEQILRINPIKKECYKSFGKNYNMTYLVEELRMFRRFYR